MVQYGWIIFFTSGDPIFPPQGNSDTTVTLKAGGTRNISLNATGSRQLYLWLCYTTDEHTTMKNISLNTSCVQCPGERSGPCDSLPNHLDWSVTRSERGSCFERTELTLTVHVINVSENDRGKFMLTWSSDEKKQGPKTNKVLTVTTLNISAAHSGVEKKNYITYIYIGVGGSVASLLLIAVGIVMIAWGIFKRKIRSTIPVTSGDSQRLPRRRIRRRTYQK